jgi:glutamate:GABA antiporter
LSGEPQLKRALGLTDVTLYLVTACSSMQWVATAATAGPSALTVWLLGAASMFLPLSVCSVWLASRYPDEGGMYVWSGRAFGPFTAFLTGWTYWTANLPYFAGMLYFAAANTLWLSGSGRHSLDNEPAWFMSFALAALILGTVLNVLGLSVSKWLSSAGAVARCGATALLLGLGVWSWQYAGSATQFSLASLRPGFSLDELLFWSAIAFAFAGPESVSLMGAEIRAPRRTVPRALLLAAPLILLVYVGGTFSVLVAVPAGELNPMHAVMQAIDRVGTHVGIGWLTPLGALLVTLTCLGSTSAYLGSVARIPFVAGIDHLLPKGFGRLHPRYGTPANALITQSAIAMLFAVLGQAGTTVKGAYEVLVNMMVVTTLLPFLPLFGAAIRLSRGPRTPDEARIPGGRIMVKAMGALGILSTLIAVGLSLLPRADEPNKALAVSKVLGLSLLLLAIGAGLYWNGMRRRARLLPQSGAETASWEGSGATG